ncbi:FAD/NAD(P)-binding oxidoreductase family protein [Gossypium australe]|uniref:FAD/NAD(P)-binding oxidoreductase family protein n=1 Tax=Gossypium australe TaxID=47621 RepID=A0A5B6WWI1_9ROSI|nr:FAD/NAD(P)-binding oxidoreductase family protein [Gossypium australe]
MSVTLPLYFLRFHLSFTSRTASTRAKNNHGYLFLAPKANTTKFTTASIPGDKPQKISAEELLVVVGGGAAGVYGAIRAKTVASNLNVLVIEKGKLLSKVKISGGGRCNVTNGHCADNLVLADHYPRGNKELRGSFFNVHGPADTMSWFVDKGVDLKTEDDGRVFPVSNNSSSVIDCLLSEAKCRGAVYAKTVRFLGPVSLQTGKLVTSASASASGKFLLKIEKRTHKSVELVEADYLLIASGSSQQGHNLAVQLGHSIVDPVPSLFTFKIEDAQLVELSGVTFSKVIVKLKLENVQRNIPQLTQACFLLIILRVGPMLVTHWGLSGPAILRLSAWGARYLYSSGYKGKLIVDFVPDLHIEDLKSMLSQQKNRFLKQKVLNSCPMELQLVKRFWKYILDREGLVGDTLWASVSNSSIVSIANLLKHCTFEVKGKGQFKDEFVTAGGVPLSEIHLNTMESRIQPNLYFAGEVLNVDGVTGGFNFQVRKLTFIFRVASLGDLITYCSGHDGTLRIWSGGFRSKFRDGICGVRAEDSLKIRFRARQNAWSGGYIAGSTIGRLAAGNANLVGAL